MRMKMLSWGGAMTELDKAKARGLVGCFLRDERGATAIEYALLVSGISILIAGAVATLGTTVKGLFTSVSSALK
jgi:pilus assembly protein Flp/PilA